MTTDLQSWVGRKRFITDEMAAPLVRRMAALTDRAGLSCARGARVPNHWLCMLFDDAAPQAALGPDGHPATGDFLPPVPLPRRMLGGRRLDYRGPVRVGDDLTRETEIAAPVAGRVEYKLSQPGAVLGSGGRIVTLLDLSDVFMTIFLPTRDVGRIGLGDEARIVLDAAPEFTIPARVSFIAAEAQFTPKFVETTSERDKLMYRVKLAIDPKLLETYRDYVKAGLTGNGYVRVQPEAAWPDRLKPRLPDAR